MKILALDPSGNFNEGKGTTGYCIAEDAYIYKADEIASAEFKTQMEYWNAIIELIAQVNKEAQDKDTKLFVVCEDYRLYASASESQINSNLETPQLIGAIKWYCFEQGIHIDFQMAAEVKNRWSNEVLEKKGLLKYDYRSRKLMLGNLYLGHHSIDAVRHCLHYTTFKLNTRTEERKARADERIYYTDNRRRFNPERRRGGYHYGY